MLNKKVYIECNLLVTEKTKEGYSVIELPEYKCSSFIVPKECVHKIPKIEISATEEPKNEH